MVEAKRHEETEDTTVMHSGLLQSQEGSQENASALLSNAEKRLSLFTMKTLTEV